MFLNRRKRNPDYNLIPGWDSLAFEQLGPEVQSDIKSKEWSAKAHSFFHKLLFSNAPGGVHIPKKKKTTKQTNKINHGVTNI